MSNRRGGTAFRLARLALLVLIAAACGDDAAPGVPEQVVLTPDAGQYGDLEYSPDGTRMTYAKLEAGLMRIWVANIDGSGARPVTPPSPDAWNPEWSPDGRSIVYESNQLGFMDLFLVPVDGGEPRQLTSGPRLEAYPKFSPDGTRIAYHDLRAGNADVWSITPEGGEPAQLTNTPAAAENGTGFSPDGRWLAFTRQEGGRATVWLLSMVDGTERALTTEGFEIFSGISWSPDSRELAVQSTRTGLSDLWAYPVDGGEPRQLTRDIRGDRTGLYSPDGRWVAFISDRGGQVDVWLVPSQGGDAMRVTDDAIIESDLRWQPDGRGLTFVRTDPVAQILALRPADGTLRTVVANRNGAQLGDVSPDGRSIAYVESIAGDANIFLATMDGGEHRVLVRSPAADIEPRFSPDGRRVAFLSERAGAFHLYVVPVDGGEEVRLTSIGSSDHAWSPSGDRLAFVTFGGTGLWVVDATGGEPTQVANLENTRFPRWSLDGSSILVSGTLSGGQAGIYDVPVAGGPPVLLTPPESADAQSPVWSPDGSMFAYHVYVDSVGAFELFVANADGTGHRRLTESPGYDVEPEWSRDGSLIYFQTERASYAEGEGSEDLAVVPVEGGEVTILHRSTAYASWGPIVTPDGSEIVFVQTPFGSHYVSVDVGALLDAAERGRR